MITADTKDRLRNWARWSQSGTIQGYRELWYPSVSIQGRKLTSNKTWDKTPKGEPIHDSDAQIVEEAVKQVYQSNETLGNCLILKWLYRESQDDIAKIYHCSRTPVKEWTASAESTIEVLINSRSMAV